MNAIVRIPAAPAISIFRFDNHDIRVVEIDGQPWFVGADVCKAARLSNPSVSLKALDEDERAKIFLGHPQGEVLVITEGGLYTLLMRSQRALVKGATAWRFRRWAMNEVLPEIRRTDSYAVAPAPTPVAIPEDLDDNRVLRRMLLARMDREDALVERLVITDQELIDTSRQLTASQRQVQRARPAVECVERFAESEELYSLQAGGKALGQKPNKFIAWLKERGDLLDLNRSNLPRQDLIDRALFRVRIEEYGGKPRATPKMTSRASSTTDASSASPSTGGPHGSPTCSTDTPQTLSGDEGPG